MALLFSRLLYYWSLCWVWRRMLKVKKIRELTMKKSEALSAAYVSAASGIALAGRHFYIAADDQLCLSLFQAR